MKTSEDMSEKQNLRRMMRRMAGMMAEEERARQSSLVCEAIMNSRRVCQTKAVMGFWPLPDEPDVRPALRRLMDAGHDIFLPRVVSDTEMAVCPYYGDESLAPGAFGILEPVTPPVALPVDAVVLVPGMAFDSGGCRLGRGRGYYDRFLAASLHYAIGVCFPHQLVDSVPHDTHDVRVDEVLRIS